MNDDYDALKKIDGKIFAMLSKSEYELYCRYERSGRKLGVTVGIVDDSNCLTEIPAEVAGDKVHDIYRLTNAVVKIWFNGEELL